MWNVVSRLAQDPDEDVRRSMAFQLVNMDRFPQLLPIAQGLAENDPSEDVRVDALQAVGRLVPVGDAVAYYQTKLSQNPSKRMLWSIIWGLRDHNEQRPAQQLLTQLGQHPDPDIANSACDALT